MRVIISAIFIVPDMISAGGRDEDRGKADGVDNRDKHTDRVRDRRQLNVELERVSTAVCSGRRSFYCNKYVTDRAANLYIFGTRDDYFSPQTLLTFD